MNNFSSLRTLHNFFIGFLFSALLSCNAYSGDSPKKDEPAQPLITGAAAATLTVVAKEEPKLPKQSTTKAPAKREDPALAMLSGGDNVIAPGLASIVVNKSIDAYLKERKEEAAKMILGCGHTPGADYIARPRIGPSSCHDINGKGAFHEHIGWYTIDADGGCKPDLVGDIGSDEICALLSQQSAFSLVYAEYLPHAVLTENVLAAVVKSLQKDGRFVFPLLPANMITSIYPSEAEKKACLSKFSKLDVKVDIHEDRDGFIFNFKRSKRLGITIVKPAYISVKETGRKIEVTFTNLGSPRVVKAHIDKNMENPLSDIDEMFRIVQLPSCYAVVQKL